MARSQKASLEGLKKAKFAFNAGGKTQDYLAKSVGFSRQTVSSFFAGRTIDTRLFQAICTELGLEWGEIAELDADSQPSIQDFDLDALVSEVRSKVRASIQKRCGTMRVLDMEQPITIDSIYTSVNILEKISRNQRSSIEELLDGFRAENFDRFILGKVQQNRISALEAVERHDKLMILGKPGSGKSTFLKWLALQCNEGKFSQNRVPLFVTLKEFSETEGQPDLLGFIAKQLTECGIENGAEVGTKILQAGRAIVLLDSLDEVKAQDHDRVLNTIRQTAEKFDASQFVITCRIAAKEYIFEQFTEVEISDFDNEQIADFAHRWFQPKDPIKAEEFPKVLKANPRLQELATNPLLLTLLCLVFEESGQFPVNRAELYKEGLDVLLKKWDAKRNIKREEVYKQLSLQRKEDLLSQVAYNAFERSDYFFKQGFVEEQIRDYIRNLPNASNDPETLQLDSEAVLTSIAAQHGLLVERARGIYSFSHLTFHEYFTARWFMKKADGDFGALISHVTDKQWREVFLLTVEMLQSANKLVLGMKREIDSLLAQEEKLQELLSRNLDIDIAHVFDLDQNIDSEDQKELLQQYHDANKLLVDCLNSDCYVSREVRAEIEASLLLPIKSLSSPLEIR
jgi:predicted NACHT family NTPase